MKKTLRDELLNLPNILTYIRILESAGHGVHLAR